MRSFTVRKQFEIGVNPGKKAFLFLASINTVILFLLTIWFWSLPWLAGDEKLMIWVTSAIKLNSREIPESEDFFLINISYDQMFIDKFDDFGFPVGNQSITDREKLTRFVRIIRESKEKPTYVFLDLFFEEPTAYDSALNIELQKLENLVVSVHLDDEKKLRSPIMSNVKLGLSDYVIGNIFEGVYKFQLFFNDSLRLTPLIIHEDIYGYKSTKRGPFVKTINGYTLNHFIMNYRVLQKDIENQEAGFNPINLGELLVLPAEDIADFLKNKIVIVGDFYERDMHESIFEITAGPVILLNAFLSIENHDTVVNIFFIVIILLVYFGVSYMAIYPEDLLEKFVRKKYGKIKWVGNLTSFMSFLIILMMASVLCYFLFNIHINVFFLTIYIFIVEKISNKIFKRSIKKADASE